MGRKRQVSARRVIPADRQAVFDVIADPAMHPVIDGSGTVREARDSAPERLEPGARFGMSMKLGAPYSVANTVVEFEEGRRLAWRHFHGHRWRYELADVEGGTEVVETFDWSGARTKWPLELAGFPERNRQAMEQTLARLEEVVAGGT